MVSVTLTPRLRLLTMSAYVECGQCQHWVYPEVMSPRDPAPTRAAIVAAAGRLLEVGGPEAVTLRSVGAEAGVSRSATYRHFEDKADLLRALAAQGLIELAMR